MGTYIITIGVTQAVFTKKFKQSSRDSEKFSSCLTYIGLELALLDPVAGGYLEGELRVSGAIRVQPVGVLGHPADAHVVVDVREVAAVQLRVHGHVEGLVGHL